MTAAESASPVAPDASLAEDASALPVIDLRAKKVPELVREVMYRVVMDDAEIEQSLIQSAFAQLLSIDDLRIRGALGATMSTCLLQRGPRVAEVTGLLAAVRDFDALDRERPYAAAVPGRGSVVTVIGSGKKSMRSLNISTPSALIAATAGGAIAKIGANCTSRITSSVELVRAVGINVDVGQDMMLEVLAKSGFGYFVGGESMAPRFFAGYSGTCVAPHALMFGWPLLAPIRSDATLYGLAHPKVGVAGEVLARLEFSNVVIMAAVSEMNVLDESTPFGTTYECRVTDSAAGDVQEHEFAAELQLPSYGVKDLEAKGRGAQDVAATLAALTGVGSPGYLATLALNSAVMLQAAGITPDLAEGFATCQSIIAAGATVDKLRELVQLTGGNQRELDRWL